MFKSVMGSSWTVEYRNQLWNEERVYAKANIVLFTLNRRSNHYNISGRDSPMWMFDHVIGQIGILNINEIFTLLI